MYGTFLLKELIYLLYGRRAIDTEIPEGTLALHTQCRESSYSQLRARGGRTTTIGNSIETEEGKERPREEEEVKGGGRR